MNADHDPSEDRWLSVDADPPPFPIANVWAVERLTERIVPVWFENEMDAFVERFSDWQPIVFPKPPRR